MHEEKNPIQQATLADLCHLKHAELVKHVQKEKGRVVTRGSSWGCLRFSNPHRWARRSSFPITSPYYQEWPCEPTTQSHRTHRYAQKLHPDLKASSNRMLAGLDQTTPSSTTSRVGQQGVQRLFLTTTCAVIHEQDCYGSASCWRSCWRMICNTWESWECLDFHRQTWVSFWLCIWTSSTRSVETNKTWIRCDERCEST